MIAIKRDSPILAELWQDSAFTMSKLQRTIRAVDRRDKVTKDHSFDPVVGSFWEERCMTIRARHLGSRLLLILALVAALLAGIMAI
jgi:hypothetical protein